MNVRRILILSLLFLTPFIHAAKKDPINLTLAKECVTDYYEGGQYDKDLKKITDRAWKQLRKKKVGNKDVIIFDIDDTVLSSYKEAKRISYGYIPKNTQDWILKSDAPAIKPVKDLYDKLVQKGYTIIFLTNRDHEKEYESTVKNLRDQGFQSFEKVILRQPSERKLKATEYKTNVHRKLLRDGHKVIACIGDQWSDFSKLCGHTVKVPNLMYIIE